MLEILSEMLKAYTMIDVFVYMHRWSRMEPYCQQIGTMWEQRRWRGAPLMEWS